MTTIRKSTRARASNTSARNLPDVHGGSRAAPPPNIRPEPVFWLAAHPGCVDVIAGKLVPTPRTIKAIAGLNGMDVTRTGTPIPANAFVHAQQNGFTVIPWDPEDPYLVQIEGHNGWISRWEKVFPGTSQRVSDQAGYAAWLEQLVEDGKIEPPASYAVAALRETIVQTIGQYSARIGKEAQIAHQRARLAVVDAWLAALDEEPPSAPAPTTGALPAVDQPAPRVRKAAA